MDEKKKSDLIMHLKLVEQEIRKLQVELQEKPDSFGDFENRMYFAMKGIDPHHAICTKHHRKLHQNDYGEFLCGDCIYDIIEQARKGVSVYDEDLWFNPQEKPTIKIKGITYGSGIFHKCLFTLVGFYCVNKRG
jgi:hypothetical protein